MDSGNDKDIYARLGSIDSRLSNIEGQLEVAPLADMARISDRVSKVEVRTGAIASAAGAIFGGIIAFVIKHT